MFRSKELVTKLGREKVGAVPGNKKAETGVAAPKEDPNAAKKALKEAKIEEERLSAEKREKDRVEEQQRLAKIERSKPPSLPRILIVGGTGTVGKEVRKKLGESVRVARR